MCHPRNFWRKSLNMIFFLFQKALRYKHWHVHILYTCPLKCSVQLLLNLFPNRIACRFNNHTTLHTRIITQLRLLYHVCVPLCEILLHRSNRFHKFLVICHLFSSFLIFLFSSKIIFFTAIQLSRERYLPYLGTVEK